jgi:hypothetical protein
MKRIKSIIFCSLVLLAASCKPDIPEFQYIAEKSVENISGQWKGVSVLQRDNDAERKKFPYQSMDITDFLGFQAFKLTLNSANGAPTTFTIDNGTSLPLFKFTTGSWTVNNAKQVTEIKLFNGADTAVLNLSPFSNLKQQKATFAYSKKLSGKPVITYELTLSK